MTNPGTNHKQVHAVLLSQLKKAARSAACLLLVQGTWAAVPNVATLEWEVESGGSNTANAACFDHLTTLAGRPTDGAATVANTASPVVTSASYNFVAGDVNQWLFIAAGTNWIPGWYKITSVASNAATLDAAVGHATLLLGGLNTVAGVATTASPTSGTWSVDYTRRTTGQFTGTDLNASTGSSVNTTSSHSFTKADVGNCIIASAGTSCTAGTYEIISVAAGVATLDSAIGASCTGATYAEGGAKADPSFTNGLGEAVGNRIWMQGPTIAIAPGTSMVGNGVSFLGYSTVRGDIGPVTLQASSGGGGFVLNTNQGRLYHTVIDCNSQASMRFEIQGGQNFVYDLLVKNCIFTSALNFNTNNTTCELCFVTASTGSSAVITIIAGDTCYICGVYSNPVPGSAPGIRLQGGICSTCFVINHGTGGSTAPGFELIANDTGASVFNSSVYNTTGDGITIDGGGSGNGKPVTVMNTIISNAGGWGINVPSPLPTPPLLDYNGYGNNTSGNLAAGLQAGAHDVTLTVDPFVNCAANNCLPNGTAGGGAALRGKGFPGTLAIGTGILDMGMLQTGTAGAAAAGAFAYSQ